MKRNPESLILMAQFDSGAVAWMNRLTGTACLFADTDRNHVLTTTTANDPWMPSRGCLYGDIPPSPAAGVLNYGQGLFEGMKATDFKKSHRLLPPRRKRSSNATRR